jgi:hypothetical protein
MNKRIIAFALAAGLTVGVTYHHAQAKNVVKDLIRQVAGEAIKVVKEAARAIFKELLHGAKEEIHLVICEGKCDLRYGSNDEAASACREGCQGMKEQEEESHHEQRPMMGM